MGIVQSMVNAALSNKAAEVAEMKERINKAVYERAMFERSKKPNGSHVEMRRTANQFADNDRVAAFFHALNVSPEVMFNRSRKDGWRSDLKGLQKVRKLIDFLTDRTHSLDTVSTALFACTIIAARKGLDWISSAEQELILSPENVGSLPSDIQSEIRKYQHKHMTVEGDSRPQACRFRTTYANLGIYHYDRQEFDDSEYSLGIKVNLDNPVVQDLASRWNLVRAN